MKDKEYHDMYNMMVPMYLISIDLYKGLYQLKQLLQQQDTAQTKELICFGF